MLDLNAQLYGATSAPSSSVSSSSALCANDHQMDIASSTAAEIASDNSNIILEAMAAISIGTPHQTSAEKVGTGTAAQASVATTTDPSATLKPRQQRLHQRLRQHQRARPGMRRLARPTSLSVDPTLKLPQLRAKLRRSPLNVFGPTNTYKFCRESSASERRRWVNTARAQGSRNIQRRTQLGMRSS